MNQSINQYLYIFLAHRPI